MNFAYYQYHLNWLGKQIDESKLSQVQKDKETQVRARKPLNDIYFINKWN